MKRKLMIAGGIALGILAVLVIEKKTGIFGKIFGYIPGVDKLV